MEAKWIEALRNSTLPEPGALTEKALAQAQPRSRQALRPFAVGSLALAATIPLAWLVLSKAKPTNVTQNHFLELEEAGLKKLTPLQEKVVATKPVNRRPHQRHQGNEPFGLALKVNDSPASSVLLTPLPGGANPVPWAHTVAFEKTKDGHLQGKVCYPLPSLDYVVEGAIFDESGVLLSTAAGVVALADSSTTLDFGESPDNAKAQHYLLGFHPAPESKKDEVLLRQASELALGGTFPVVLEKLRFFQSPTDNTIVGRVSTTLAKAKEKTTVRTVHGVLLSEEGALLSTARASLKNAQEPAVQEQTFQLNFGRSVEGVARYQLAVSNLPRKSPDILLTPLPSATILSEAKSDFVCHADGRVSGTLTFVRQNTQLGLATSANKVYEGDVVVFDAKGELLSSAKTELSALGGSAQVDLGYCPSARHYQVLLTPRAAKQVEERGIAGYQELALKGTGRSLPNVTLGPVTFTQSNADKEIDARLVASITTAEAANYTFHLALFDEKRLLLDTTRSTMSVPKIVLGKPLLVTRELRLSLRPTKAVPAQYQFSVTKTKNALEETMLTLLPSAPAPRIPGFTTHLVRQAEGEVSVALTLAPNPKERGAIPKAYDADVALFNAQGELLTTAKAQVPGQGGTTKFRLRSAPTTQHYLVGLTPQSTVADRKIVGGYQRVAVAGRPLSTAQATLTAPELYQSNVDKDYFARLTASVAVADTAERMAHLAVFNQQGALLRTAQEKLAPGQIDFKLGGLSAPPARQQLAVTTAPKVPDADFTVATTHTEAGDALVLMPKRPEYPAEEVRINPSLRDYTQIKLTAGVVAALRAKGIASLVGKRVQVKGKTERSLYLSSPAFEVTTVTVERPEDILIVGLKEEKPKPILLPNGNVQTVTPAGMQSLMAQELLRRLKDAKDGQARYPLLIGPEFEQTLLAAADRGDEATVIALVQYSWFGGPESATKGGNALTWAAYCPTAEPVKRLLARDINPGIADADGNTGLHRTYREEIARLLLEKNAPVDPRNKNGETPLILQARQCDRWLGHLGVIQALLAKKADPNATDNAGRTALMHAAKSGIVEAVEALLKAGADPKRKDKQGKSAADYAAPWHWQSAPGFATQERLNELERQANADVVRIKALLTSR